MGPAWLTDSWAGSTDNAKKYSNPLQHTVLSCTQFQEAANGCATSFKIALLGCWIFFKPPNLFPVSKCSSVFVSRSLGYDKGRHTISPSTRSELMLLSRTFSLNWYPNFKEADSIRKRNNSFLKHWKILNSSIGSFGAIDNLSHCIESLKCQVQNKVSHVYNGTWNNIFETCKLSLASQTENGALSTWALEAEGEDFKFGFTHSIKESWDMRELVPHDYDQYFVPRLCSRGSLSPDHCL